MGAIIRDFGVRMSLSSTIRCAAVLALMLAGSEAMA